MQLGSELRNMFLKHVMSIGWKVMVVSLRLRMHRKLHALQR